MALYLLHTLLEEKLTLKSCHRTADRDTTVLVPPHDFPKSVATVMDFFPEATGISEGYFMILGLVFPPYLLTN